MFVVDMGGNVKVMGFLFSTAVFTLLQETASKRTVAYKEGCFLFTQLNLVVSTNFILHFKYTGTMTDRIINRNKILYGPGPLGRKPFGLGAKPPLQGLVICAVQGIAVGLVGGLFYNVTLGNPLIASIEKYYKENPTR